MPKDDEVLDQFSEEFPSQDGVKKEDDEFAEHSNSLDEPEKGQKQEENDDEDLPVSPKNRRERRLSRQLELEKAANVELAAKLAAQSEFARFREDTKTMNVDERLLTLYGTDERGRRAAEITQSILEDTAKRAREGALADLQSQQEQVEKQVSVETDYINSQLEDLEDEHGIDLTSNTSSARKARSEFLDYVEHLSPKDKEGDIIEFADFATAFDEWQVRRRAPSSTTRAKDFASRGMNRSGSSSKTVQTQAGEKFLKDAGII